MSTFLFLALALFAAPQDPGAKEEPDPIAAADAAERKRDRDFAGPGSAAVQTLDVGAAPGSPPQAYKPPSVRPFEMPAFPRGSGDAEAEAPVPAAAVTVERYSRSYEPPKTEVELFYEAGVKSAFDRAQSRLGSLDGAWTLRRADGAPLYALVFVDDGSGGLDAAWRDLRGTGGGPRLGVALSAIRTGDEVTVRFSTASPYAAATVRLRPDAGSRWRGTLDTGEGGTVQVIMGRN